MRAMTPEEKLKLASELIKERKAPEGTDISDEDVLQRFSETRRSEMEEESLKHTKAGTYKLQIMSVSLLVKRLTVSERLYSHHTKLLSQGKNLRYFFYKISSHWQTVAANLSRYQSNKLSTINGAGSKLFICFYESDRLQVRSNWLHKFQLEALKLIISVGRVCITRILQSS